MSFDKKFWSRQWELWNHESDRNENFRYWLLPSFNLHFNLMWNFTWNFSLFDNPSGSWQIKNSLTGQLPREKARRFGHSRLSMRTFQFDMRTQWRCLKRNQIIEQEVQLFCSDFFGIARLRRVFLFCWECSHQVAMICGNFNRGLHYGRRNVDCKVVRTWKVEILIARIRTGTVSVTFCHEFKFVHNNCDTFSMQTGF